MRFRQIEALLPVGSYLDVGCAFGFSLDVAAKRGWDAEGVDISVYACEVAAQRGAHVTCVDFLNFHPHKAYDLISAWDVIEHTSSPGAFVKQVSRCLRVGGLLALTTPDSGAVVAKLLGRRWFEYKWPEHIYYLDRKSIRQYCEKFGFRPLRLQVAVKYKTLADAFARWVGIYEVHKSPNNKKRIIVPYSSLTEMLLIAQKIA